MDTCLKNTLVLNKNSKVFLSPKQHPDIVVDRGGLIMTIPSKIILLQWESQEKSWIEFKLYHLLLASDNINVIWALFVPFSGMVGVISHHLL